MLPIYFQNGVAMIVNLCQREKFNLKALEDGKGHTSDVVSTGSNLRLSLVHVL
jgi:hypothetical protein